jgi:hypothetical protein
MTSAVTLGHVSNDKSASHKLRLCVRIVNRSFFGPYNWPAMSLNCGWSVVSAARTALTAYAEARSYVRNVVSQVARLVLLASRSLQ